MKKANILLGVFTLLLIGSLLIFGFSNNKTAESFTGLAGSIDISPNGQKIVFSYYENGTASIYTANVDGSHAKRLTFSEKMDHVRPQFSPDGKKILFLGFHANKDERSQAVYMISTDGSNLRRVSKQVNALITDAVFSPDGKSIYFLKAGVYKNYSPIASKNPHEFDIYSMNLDGSNVHRLTHLNHYDMADLSVSTSGNKLFFTSFGELDGPDSPEESFKSSQMLYMMSLKDPAKIKNVQINGSFGSPGVFDAQISPAGNIIAFKAVAGANESGTFEYELFVMDRDTEEINQLTNLHEQITSPVFNSADHKIYFLEYSN